MQDVGRVGLVVLDGPLTIRTIEPVAATLREALAQHQALSIDCSAAGDVDVAFLQLLAAAHTSARQGDKRVALAAPPEGGLLDALHRAGLEITRQTMPGTGQDGYWFEGAIP